MIARGHGDVRVFSAGLLPGVTETYVFLVQYDCPGSWRRPFFFLFLSAGLLPVVMETYVVLVQGYCLLSWRRTWF